MVGGGSGGIASARRAAEFGVKVEHNKSRDDPEEFFLFVKICPKKEDWVSAILHPFPLLRWALLREAAWEALA